LKVHHGDVLGMASKTRNRWDLIRFLDHLEQEIPVIDGQTIVAVSDNLCTRGTQEVTDWLDAHPRWSFQFTPKHASWLTRSRSSSRSSGGDCSSTGSSPILEPFVQRVVVVSPDDTGISSARAKTDKLDARTLASLLWRGELDAVWVPDERCRILRRRLARREQLVRARTRSKNEIQATLQRRLVAKAPFADLFGVRGRRWLADLELPVEERESVDAGLRHV